MEFCPAKSQAFNAAAGMASNAREAFASTSGLLFWTVSCKLGPHHNRISCLLKDMCQRKSLARPAVETDIFVDAGNP